MAIATSKQAEHRLLGDRSSLTKQGLAALGGAWRVRLAVPIILFTLLGYWLCPGHLYLSHDTLVYVPMMERLWDATVLKTDLLATRPHLAFTIYDEVALGLRRLTGFSFREVLTFEQW